MRFLPCALVALLPSLFIATTASAACEGKLGRSWASGKGDGQYQMVTADKSCQVKHPVFHFDNNREVVANEMKLTRAPKSGKITLTATGPVYTPAAGFKGADKFCIQNKAKDVGGTMSGCITVTVK